ncbi:MAG TPA: hypothetical protein ENN41_00950 [Sediminispirochaeta sp.]|nr:hypothetical protein [Sediminispirochaeta sp.]
MKRRMSGNTAVAYGALRAGIAVATGYPGTPSSETLGELYNFSIDAKKQDPSASVPHVEWSTNEKVALELAAGAAWAGQRALVTMKMSGANVALDSLISVAYSGTRGGLVIFIADDPGAEAGMPEQDSRIIAELCNLPVIEPENPRQAFLLTQLAFEISEQSELPIILRSVTSLSHAVESFDLETKYRDLRREAGFYRDITRFTKAGAQICLDQHRGLLAGAERVRELFRTHGLNRFEARGSLTILSTGVLNRICSELQEDYPEAGFAFFQAPLPPDRELFGQILAASDRVLVLEELEPVLERELRSFAQQRGWTGRIVGKQDGVLSRVGRYQAEEFVRVIDSLLGRSAADQKRPAPSGELSGVKHPITFCEGCPHRGTYMALNRALRVGKFGTKETIVTGDIGCTILGMNPPFNSCWTEVSMGSSIGLAQGFVRGGAKKPVVATIGDSTFFHGGIPQLVNAVQHRTEMVLIILDNGWTSMTGFQENPGTAAKHQRGPSHRVEIDKIVEAIGVDSLEVIHPFQQEKAVESILRALRGEGIRVIISRAECALTKLRREPNKFVYRIDPEKCTYCKVCILQTGCPALYITAVEDKDVVAIDPHRCTACSLCYQTCKFEAISPVGGVK